MSQLITVRTLQDIEELQSYLADKDLIAFDTETTGLNKDSEIIGFSICAEEDKAYYVVLQEWIVGRGEPHLAPGYIWIKSHAEKLLISLIGKKLIMHNGVFDCSMVENYFKVRLIDSLHTDTMILAHLLDENRRVGLKELGASMFGEDAKNEAEAMKASVIKNGGSVTKGNYEIYKADSSLLALYGAQDALLTYKLFIAMVPELYEQGLDSFFYQDESMPLLRGPTYELNTTGLRIDTNALITLRKTLEAECAEAKAFIYAEIRTHTQEKYPGTNKKNTFSITSNNQLAWLLFEKMGLEFSYLTDSGKKACQDLGLKIPYYAKAKNEFIQACKRQTGQTQQLEVKTLGKTIKAKKYKDPWCYMTVDKGTLKNYADKYKWIAKLLEYQKKNKILTTYIKGLEEKLQYGIIRPSFLMHGTTSGRYSSRSPNWQNLPRDDKRIKQCIVSRPGKVFVGADYSQLEPRVFSYVSGDKALKAAFNGQDDFYSVIGIEVYGITDATPRKDGSPDAFGIKYKKLRDLSKVIALASTYGATARQLAPTTGKSIDDTQEDIDSYFEKFPGVKQMMLDSHEMAKTKGFVESAFGRKRRIPEALKIKRMYPKVKHSDLPYNLRSLLNLAVNHRIQGTAANIVNRAMIRFNKDCKEIGIDCQMVSQVHDSIIIECSEQDAENVSIVLQNAMENTTILEGVPLEAIPKIGKDFSEV